MKKDKKSPGILPALFNCIRNLPDSGQKQLALANLTWQKVVGPLIGKNTWVENISDNGTLTIHVTKREWISVLKSARQTIILNLNELRMLKHQILNYHLVLKPQNREQVSPDNTGETDALSEHMEMINGIPDPVLREILIRVIRTYPHQPPADQA